MLTIENELDKWKQIKTFLEFYLDRNIGPEIIPAVLLEAFKELTLDLLEKTKRANCNCINYDEFEELNEKEEQLEKLLELLK